MRAQAHGIKRRLPPYCISDVDDLQQDGWIGILQAVSRFDPSKGVERDTYLMVRSYYSMWDGVRRLEWAIQNHRSHPEEHWEWVGDTIDQTIADPGPLPDEQLERQQRATWIGEWVARLSERDRSLLRGLYWRECSVPNYAAERGVQYQAIYDHRAKVFQMLRRTGARQWRNYC